MDNFTSAETSQLVNLFSVTVKAHAIANLHLHMFIMIGCNGVQTKYNFNSTGLGRSRDTIQADE